MELGRFFADKGETQEAAEWFYRASHECESELDIASSGADAFMALSECFRTLGEPQKADEYEQLAKEWKPQESAI